ncbi:MAG TPA: hypothetical protein VGB53_04465, partial [Rubricoccaceae bacterium]
MSPRFSRGLLLALAAFAFSTYATAQTVIASQGFETAGETWGITAGATNISTTAGSGDTPANGRIRSGVRSWQVNNATATLTLAPQPTIGYTGIQAVVRISSPAANTTNGSDVGDYVRV